MIGPVISVWSWLWRQRGLVVGLLLVATGAAVTVMGARGDSTFGWFAYAPLSDSVFPAAGDFVVRRLTVIGLVLLVIGLVWVAGVVGYRLAASRRSIEPGTSA